MSRAWRTSISPIERLTPSPNARFTNGSKAASPRAWPARTSPTVCRSPDSAPSVPSQDGILVAARINGGKPLRLLLDTGARGIILNPRAARDLALETIVASSLSGFGEAGAGESRVALARTVAFGDLTFEECLIEVAGRSLTTGADGVIGADIFQRFKIGVDAHARLLQLTPFDDVPGETPQTRPSQPSASAICCFSRPAWKAARRASSC